jgi:hypothetical protein
MLVEEARAKGEETRDERKARRQGRRDKEHVKGRQPREKKAGKSSRMKENRTIAQNEAVRKRKTRPRKEDLNRISSIKRRCLRGAHMRKGWGALGLGFHLGCC